MARRGIADAKTWRRPVVVAVGMIGCAALAVTPAAAQKKSRSKTSPPVMHMPAPPRPPVPPLAPTPPAAVAYRIDDGFSLRAWIESGRLPAPVQRARPGFAMGQLHIGMRGNELAMINTDGWMIKERPLPFGSEPSIVHSSDRLSDDRFGLDALLGGEYRHDTLSITYSRAAGGAASYTVNGSYSGDGNCTTRMTKLAKQWGVSNPHFSLTPNRESHIAAFQADTPPSRSASNGGSPGVTRATIAYRDGATCLFEVAVVHRPTGPIPVRNVPAMRLPPWRDNATMAQKLYASENWPRTPITAAFSCDIMPVSRALFDCRQTSGDSDPASTATAEQNPKPWASIVQDLWQAPPTRPQGQAMAMWERHMGGQDLPDYREVATITLRNERFADLGGLNHAMPDVASAYVSFTPPLRLSSDDYPSAALRTETEGNVNVYCSVQADRSLYCPRGTVVPESANVLLRETLWLVRRRKPMAPEQIQGRPAAGQFITFTVRWSIPS